jgi:hypothetical protein
MADGDDERLKEEVQQAQLKLQQGLKEEMFECLFKAWSYSPVSTLSLCLFCQVQFFLLNNIYQYLHSTWQKRKKKNFLCQPSDSVFSARLNIHIDICYYKKKVVVPTSWSICSIYMC